MLHLENEKFYSNTTSKKTELNPSLPNDEVENSKKAKVVGFYSSLEKEITK